MAIASVKAIAKIMAVWIFEEASGFRPIASMALAANFPIPKAGPMAPMPMAMAAAMDFNPSAFDTSIKSLANNNYQINSPNLLDNYHLLVNLFKIFNSRINNFRAVRRLPR